MKDCNRKRTRVCSLEKSILEIYLPGIRKTAQDRRSWHQRKHPQMLHTQTSEEA